MLKLDLYSIMISDARMLNPLCTEIGLRFSRCIGYFDAVEIRPRLGRLEDGEIIQLRS
ncbi:hypothetical protein LTR93_012118, partial [Exophiala xenobiotica]